MKEFLFYLRLRPLRLPTRFRVFSLRFGHILEKGMSIYCLYNTFSLKTHLKYFVFNQLCKLTTTAGHMYKRALFAKRKAGRCT